MQETLVQSLIQKEPTCLGATKLVHHNHWACALEPRSRNCWAHALQQEKPLPWEALALQLRVAPQLPATTEKPAQQWRPSTAKINNFSFFLKGKGHIVCLGCDVIGSTHQHLWSIFDKNQQQNSQTCIWLELQIGTPDLTSSLQKRWRSGKYIKTTL